MITLTVYFLFNFFIAGACLDLVVTDTDLNTGWKITFELILLVFGTPLLFCMSVYKWISSIMK